MWCVNATTSKVVRRVKFCRSAGDKCVLKKRFRRWKMFDALNSISEGYLCIGLDRAMERRAAKRMPVNGDLGGLS